MIINISTEPKLDLIKLKNLTSEIYQTLAGSSLIELYLNYLFSSTEDVLYESKSLLLTEESYKPKFIKLKYSL